MGSPSKGFTSNVAKSQPLATGLALVKLGLARALR